MINKAARNERRKITATALNTIAMSLIVTGIVIPVVTFPYQTVPPVTTSAGAAGVFWAGRGIALHLLSRRVLPGIED